MSQAWLTPNTAPASFYSRCLHIPEHVDFLAIVAGCLLSLTYPQNFEKFGTLTPEETADIFSVMFDEFCLQPGACKVVGEIVCYAGNINPYPLDWLACDGSLVSSVDYPDLWPVIGTTFGGTGSTSFAVPDLRGRVVLGLGNGGTGTTYALGDVGGEETHTLTAPEMPVHNHWVANVALLGTAAPPPLDALGPNPIPTGTGNAGGDGPHENRQPYIALNYFIVAR